MNGVRSYIAKEPSPRGRFFCFSVNRERGNALLYIMLAVGLLAALTYAYVQDSHGSAASQNSVQLAESLYSQINMIKTAITECAAEYPGGGEDATSSIHGTANANPNMPYPLVPSSALSPYLTPGGCTTSGSASGCVVSTATTPGDSDNDVMNLACAGAPAGAAYMFTGASNQGRFLPPPASGFLASGSSTAACPGSTPCSAWTYGNDTSFGGAGGVYIQTTSTGDASSVQALSRLENQFTSKQYTVTNSGLTFTVWIVNNN